MDVSGPLEFFDFDKAEQPLHRLPLTCQKEYITKYLEGLNAKTVIVEPCYFDKDYLDEFSYFYSRSSQGYRNVCKRLHFFRNSPVTRSDLTSAASDDQEKLSVLKANYLGFIVLRPIAVAPFGRTVLALYDDTNLSEPRVTTPARKYTVSLSGIELEVDGLAWQQQDTGVAACATIGLWTMFHSSAFDEHHSIPTTAEITESARVFGRRAFPSTGLTLEQIMEAIHKQDLNPIAVSGDLATNQGRFFSKERFANNVAAFVRSGYPILIAGNYEGHGGHALCIVGFRDKFPENVVPGTYTMADKDIEYVYVHDDNYGPNIRFKIEEGSNKEAVLVSSPPDYVGPNRPGPTLKFTPHTIVAATHQDVRISADELFDKGVQTTHHVVNFITHICKAIGAPLPAFIFSPRFIILRDYFKYELAKALSGTDLGRVRLLLHEQAPPMSLHLGVIRIGSLDKPLLMDLLYDTTDSGRNMSSFVCVIYDKAIYNLLSQLGPDLIEKDLGLPRHIIPAF